MEFRSTGELKGRMAQQRKETALDVLSEARMRTESEKLAGRLDFAGRDSNGKLVQSKKPSELGMRIAESGLCRSVNVRFRGEEGVRQDGAPAISRKTAKTDIFKAVRMLKHVRETYEKDWARRDSVAERAEAINAELERNGQWMGRAEIDGNGGIEDRVKELLGEIANDKVMSKRMAALKLSEIFGYLEAAKYLEGTERQPKIAAACTKIVAFRNRYSEWRNREVAGRMEYNRLRECALRSERDRMLGELLLYWAGKVERYGFKVAALWKQDMKKQGDGFADIKPWRIADELEKTGDAYMGPTIGRIRKAVELLVEKKVVERAAALFRETAGKIKEGYSD